MLPSAEESESCFRYCSHSILREALNDCPQFPDPGRYVVIVIVVHVRREILLQGLYLNPRTTVRRVLSSFLFCCSPLALHEYWADEIFTSFHYYSVVPYDSIQGEPEEWTKSDV